MVNVLGHHGDTSAAQLRALGVDLPGLSRKSIERRPYPPGQHGPKIRRKVSDFGKQLNENDFGKALPRYYLHPSVVVSGEGLAGQMELPGGRAVRWRVVGGTARLAAATWHPEFGLSIPCQCLEVVFDGQQAHVEFAWD